MQRRAFLSAVGIGLTSVTGCLASADDGGSTGDDETTDAPPTTDEPDTDDSDDSLAVDAGERVTAVVGTEPDGDSGFVPHRLRLTNDTEEPWVARIEVTPTLAHPHAGTYKLAPDAEVSVVLRVPADYDVRVTDVQSGATATESLSPDDFDCNQSWTAFSPDGDDISVAGASTRMACAPPTLTGDDALSVTVGDGSLSSESYTKPHAVSVGNETDETTLVDVAIETDEGRVAFGGRYRLESDARVDVRVTEQSALVARVVRLDNDTEKAVSIDQSVFDCNNSRTTISLDDSGGLTSATASTLMACQKPE
ncbi:hypothetical protein KU306_13200 [Haloferax larsenii]|uniref:Uncharacterized protein n=1 Tax=Haloferax larsenii TaxID=302484 RepID=A0ABY5RBX6_HALLR|nr:hypothetical protein [Haloferax larsenii]UVE49861.1 hypothetical protein KU306_13200 [Haloferax larsenii]